jgi:hypothetical protein
MGSMHNNERLLVELGNVEALAIRASSAGGGGSAGESTSLVYRPGGTPAPGVFVTSAALRAALDTIDEAADKVIVLDAGTGQLDAADSPWPLNNVTFESGQAVGLLTFEAGMTIKNTSTTIRARNIGIAVDPASAAAMLLSNMPDIIIDFQSAVFSNLSAAPMVDVIATQTLAVLNRDASAITGPLAKIETGGAVEVVSLGGSTVTAGAFIHGAVAGGVLLVVSDPSSAQMVSPQTDAGNLAVTASILDTAPNTTQASGAVGSPGNSVNVVTGNIVQTRTGSKMLVMATIAGVTAGATTVTLQLKRDGAGGTSIGNPIVATTLSAGDGFEGAINFIDTPPDTATHTYALVATAGAGNITCAANSIQITVAEIS